jgi:hypothetical protein
MLIRLLLFLNAGIFLLPISRFDIRKGHKSAICVTLAIGWFVAIIGRLQLENDDYGLTLHSALLAAFLSFAACALYVVIKDLMDARRQTQNISVTVVGNNRPC